MKNVFIIFAFLLLFSCGSKNVEVGMTTKEVISILGEPQSKQDFGNNAMWFYEDQMIAFQSDTVTKVNSKEDVKKATEEFLKK